MNKNAFRNLFEAALNRAAESAEVQLARPVSRSFLVELHGAGSAGDVFGVEEAADRLFLDDDRFYKIIDVSIRKLLPNKAQAFVRVSGHAPVPFSETWSPSDLGPFKQIVADRVEDESQSSA